MKASYCARNYRATVPGTSIPVPLHECTGGSTCKGDCKPNTNQLQPSWSKDRQDAYMLCVDKMRDFKRMSKGWAILNHAAQYIRDRGDD